MRILNRILSALITITLIFQIQVNAQIVDDTIETRGTAGVLMNEDGIEFKRFHYSKEKGIDNGYLFYQLAGTPDFYIDLTLREPQEANANRSFRMVFVHAKTNSGDKSWFTPVWISGGKLYATIGNRNNAVLDMGNNWHSLRFIFTVNASKTYDMKIMHIKNGAYEELASGAVGSGDLTSLAGWVMINNGALGGDEIYDLANFKVRTGSSENDDSQLKEAEKFNKKPSFDSIDNVKERDLFIKLYNLGILSFDSDVMKEVGDYYRKRDMALALTTLHKIDTDMDTTNQEIKYKDLNENDFVCIAALKAGIMTSLNDVLFGSDDIINGGDIASYLLDLLDYNAMLNSSVTQKDKFDIMVKLGYFKGSRVKSIDHKLSKRDAAIVLNNLLNLNVPQIVYNSNGTIGEIITDKSFLSEVMGVYELKNVVIEANEEFSVNNTVKKCEKNMISIDSELYYAGNIDKRYTIPGMEVTVLYTEDEKTGGNKILHITLNDENIQYIEDDSLISLSNSLLEYEASDKDKKIKLSNPIVIYNKESTENLTDLSKLISNADTFEGKITYIDNRSKRDVLIIEQYTVALVEGVDTENNIIFNVYSDDIVLFDNKYEIVSNNEELHLSDIERNDVITVMKGLPNTDGSYFTHIYVSKSILSSAEVLSIKNDNRLKVRIDNSDIRVSADFNNYLKTQNTLKLYNGMTADFLLDIYGNIAGIKNVLQEVIGYVTKCKEAELENGDVYVCVRVFNQYGEFEELRLNQKCTIDGEKINGVDSQKNILIQNSNIEQTVIRYKKNKSGVTTKIDTINQNKKNDADTLQCVLKKGFRRYNASNQAIANKIGLTDDCIYFKIPVPDSYMFDDEQMFLIQKPVSGDKSINEAYSTDGKGVFYDSGNNKIDAAVANVCVSYYPTMYSTPGILLVEDVSQAWNEALESEVTKIRAYSQADGEIHEYCILSDAAYLNNVAAGIKPGCVIKAAFDAYGNIIDNAGKTVSFESEFNQGNGTVMITDCDGNIVRTDVYGNALSSPISSSVGDYTDPAYVVCEAESIIGDNVIAKNLSSSEYETLRIKNAKVYVVTKQGNRNTIERKNTNILMKNDKFVAYTYGADVKMMVIYK